MRDFVSLSQTRSVSMGDEWFDIANLNHFWIRRRFEVLLALAGEVLRQARSLAEVGCGHGLLQRQLEDELGVAVDGYDLNTHALAMSESRRSDLFCYDIFERRPELLGKHDVLFLFDVIEHLDNDAAFLACAAEHVVPGGSVLVNVPALQGCYSAYDRAVGHVRRYDIRSLEETARRAGLVIERFSYWGLPLLPLLWWRKLTIHGRGDAEIIRNGMQPPGALANRLLMCFSRLESCPQQLTGTSLMAVLRKKNS